MSPVWLFSASQPGLFCALAVSAILVVLVIWDASLIPGTNHVQLTRSTPTIVGIGETVDGSYQIESNWPKALRGFISDSLPNGVIRDSSSINAILSIPEFGVATTPSFTLRGNIRGEWPLGSTAFTVLGPLQLSQRTLKYYPTDTISVIPAFTGNRRYRLAAIQQRMSDVGERALRRRGTSTAFNNLRDYNVGDDPRHIDWKASARRNRLISREFSVEQGQTIIIAVDAGRMMTQIAGEYPRFEYALSSALTLADVAMTAGDRVGLMVFNDEVREYVPPARGGKTLTSIRDALIRSSATVVEPDYSAAFRTLATRQRKRALIVLFTDVIDIRSSRAVIANTARTVGRHLPLVVALQNEQLTAAALPAQKADNFSTYTNAAAEELLLARDEALRRMRQAGVAVLDTPPKAMTAGLINQYLEIKDRSLL